MARFNNSGSGRSEDWLIPGNTVQYFFKGDMTEETGNGVTATLSSGTATHQLDSNGEFTASDGTNANDEYSLISLNTFTDSVIRTDNITENEIVIITGSLFYSAAPAAAECIFSYGNGAAGQSNMSLIMSTGGSLQLTIDDGTDTNTVAFGNTIYGYGAYFPFLIAMYGDTNTVDYMVGTDYTENNGMKSGYIYGGVAPDARGLCLFANNIYNDQRSIMGADNTITSKVKGLTFRRFSSYVNVQQICREMNTKSGRQLRTPYAYS